VAHASVKNGKHLPLILHGLDEGQVPASVAFVRNSLRALEHAVLP
jgi:hypothetical protein